MTNHQDPPPADGQPVRQDWDSPTPPTADPLGPLADGAAAPPLAVPADGAGWPAAPMADLAVDAAPPPVAEVLPDWLAVPLPPSAGEPEPATLLVPPPADCPEPPARAETPAVVPAPVPAEPLPEPAPQPAPVLTPVPAPDQARDPAPDPAPPPRGWSPVRVLRPEGPSPVRPVARATVFYIDADNQVPACAEALIGFFARDLGCGALTAVIAGNNTGHQVAQWSAALRTAAPGIRVREICVPVRKEAADLALIMELGAGLAGHLAAGDLIVLCSRDDLLIGAAERARALGAACVVAHGPVVTLNRHLPTVVLPLADDRPVMDLTPPAPAAGTGADRGADRTPGEAPPSVASQPPALAGEAAPPADPAQRTLVALRAMCKPDAAGGYAANVIGQALAKLGYDAKARQVFLTTTSGIRVQGSGAQKRYLF